MSKTAVILVASLATAAAFNAAAADVAPDTPLITDGKRVVDATDFHANVLRIPEARRAEFRTSYERVASVVDNLFVARSFADRARELGLDRDPVIQRRMLQAQEAVLADLYMQKIEKEVASQNLEQRARELYKTNLSKYKSPEEVNVHHILVNLQGRTREAALERARQIVADARSGKEDFLQLAAKYSDDPEKRNNGGRLGLNSPTSFNEPVSKAIAALKPGQISDPVESHQGIHIVKLVERKAPQVAPFEAVRDSIIKSERERLQKERLETVVRQIREAPSVTVHRDNVEALVVPVDAEAVSRAMGKASK